MQCMWKGFLCKDINVIACGKVFSDERFSILLGCTDGKVRAYKFVASSKLSVTLEPVEVLETKAGPVQTLVVENITKLSVSDIVVGDSTGMLTIFCNGQILHRQQLSGTGIEWLELDQCFGGKFLVMASDQQGHLHGFEPHTQAHWNKPLSSFLQNKGMECGSKINCMLAVTMASRGDRSQLMPVLLVADDAGFLHFFVQGEFVESLALPEPAVSMCKGHFKSRNNTDENLDPTLARRYFQRNFANVPQVALAADSGSVLILNDWKLMPEVYCECSVPVNKVTTLPTSQPTKELDYLLCTGFSNSLFVYKDGEMLHRYECEEWVSTVAAADINNDGYHEIILALLNGSVHILKLVES